MRKDIDLNLAMHPVTRDLVIRKDSSAIRQSVRNIVMTNFYERGFNVELGTNIKGSLFELVSQLDIQVLIDKIKASIQNFEPQVEIVDIEVINNNSNAISLKVIYTEFNSPIEVSVPVVIERSR